MVNVCTRRLSNVSRRAVAARGVPNNVETTSCTRLNTDSLDNSRIDVRKRSRWTLDGSQPPHPLGHGPLNGGFRKTAGMGPSNDVSHASSSLAFRSEVTDDTVGTSAKQNRHMTSEVLALLPDEDHSGETIKTEMELVVLL